MRSWPENNETGLMRTPTEFWLITFDTAIGTAVKASAGSAGTNEDHEPDDEDIACLAGVLSTALEDSEEEGADEGLAAAEDAAKQAQDARVKKLSEPELEPEKPEQSEKSEPPEKPTVKQSEKPEQAVYGELPPGLYMADLLRDERVQAVLREMAPVVGGGETEREPEPYCMDEAGNRVVA
jgi:hypothetical protein